MALTDWNCAGPGFDPAPAPSRPGYQTALGALPRLQAEALANFALAGFLSRSACACITLLVTGALALAATGLSDGGTLKTDFTWAVLVLLGIIAMTRNYIRGFARSLRRVPLQEAASDLRVLLLYTGAAWGSGAYLLMPGNPAPALAIGFAVLPCLALALVLKDRPGSMAFVVPVSLGVAGAALLGAWPLDMWVAGTICACVLAIASLPALQHAHPPGH